MSIQLKDLYVLSNIKALYEMGEITIEEYQSILTEKDYEITGGTLVPLNTAKTA